MYLCQVVNVLTEKITWLLSSLMLISTHLFEGIFTLHIHKKHAAARARPVLKLSSENVTLTSIVTLMMKINKQALVCDFHSILFQLTLADLSVFETFTFPLSIHPDVLDDHLELQEHRQRIETHKHLADYIKNRPLRPV